MPPYRRPHLEAPPFRVPGRRDDYTTNDAFLVGDALLVAPITRPGIEHRHVYLPRGTWCHFWTSEQIEGPTHVLAHAPLGQPAIYARANTTIPLWSEINHVGEKPTDPLTLLIHPVEGTGDSTLYEDARRSVICEMPGGGISVHLGEQEGSFAPERGSIHLELRAVNTRPESVFTNGEDTDWDYEEADGKITVRLPKRARETTVKVRF